MLAKGVQKQIHASKTIKGLGKSLHTDQESTKEASDPYHVGG